jgi:hypothetical protein
MAVPGRFRSIAYIGCMHSRRAAVAAAFALAVAVGTGCSSADDSEPTTSSSPTTTAGTSEASGPPEIPTAPPGQVSVSPGGVTTAVGAPASSTEDEYFKACESARAWMAQQGGDPNAQFEPYLRSVQSSDAPSPGTFGEPWSRLAPERQAAVIVAAQAAADALCG